MTPKKILVVDDSAFMRTIISDLISQEADFAIVGTANNGVEALEKVKKLKPDAITLDVEMPVCNGIEALKLISKECPTPVIMLSSLTEEGGKQTIEALENGAFDFVCKPSPTTGSKDINKVGEMLRDKLHEAIKSSKRNEHKEQLDLSAIHNRIKEAASAVTAADRQVSKKLKDLENNVTVVSKESINRQIPSVRSKQSNSAKSMSLNQPAPMKREIEGNREDKLISKQPINTRKKLEHSKLVDESYKVEERNSTPDCNTTRASSKHIQFSEIIAIGTSTGGPRALKEVLSGLPETLPTPVFIVQHMPPNFTKSLSERLNSSSKIAVKEAEHGEVVYAGTAYIAPGGQHMTVVERSDGKLIIELNHDEQRSGHRPSVDVMFESLKQLNRYKRHIVLLTGMGSDGAKAMRELYDSGVTSTFAESEESCIVYGMPRAAIELDCVSHVVKLQDMAREIVKAIE